MALHAGGDAKGNGIVGLSRAGRSEKDDVFFIFDKSECFEFLKLCKEHGVIFVTFEA